MKTTKPTKKAQPKSKSKAKPKPKAKKQEKPVKPKWDKPEKLEHIPQSYIAGTEPHNLTALPTFESNQKYLDMVASVEKYEVALANKNRVEKAAIIFVLAFIMTLLGWMWTFSDSRNEINNLKQLEQTYQFQVDSLTQVVGDLEANLQTALDTLHNNTSKIPDEILSK